MDIGHWTRTQSHTCASDHPIDVLATLAWVMP